MQSKSPCLPRLLCPGIELSFLSIHQIHDTHCQVNAGRPVQREVCFEITLWLRRQTTVLVRPEIIARLWKLEKVHDYNEVKTLINDIFCYVFRSDPHTTAIWCLIEIIQNEEISIKNKMGKRDPR